MVINKFVDNYVTRREVECASEWKESGFVDLLHIYMNIRIH